MTELSDHLRKALGGPDAVLWGKLLQRVDDFVRGLTPQEAADLVAGRKTVTVVPVDVEGH